MGGNLFKLGRLPKAAYLEIETEVRKYLMKKVSVYHCIPRYYGDKADFGDLDIIISKDGFEGSWQDFREEIIKDLDLKEYKSTGAVFSTVYRNFQVDYFVVDHKYFHSYFVYLSFNDIGNLIGRIFKRFNLKYGEKGLFYVFRRREGNYVKDILVSLNYEKIFEFLGLDFAHWDKGFANKKEMFDWVCSSPYFSVKPYKVMSASMEKRKRLRSTIQAFLKYIEEYNIEQEYQFDEDRDSYIPLIADYFPEADLITAIENEKQREIYVDVIKKKFNGRLLMEWLPNITGKELGSFINNFQESLGEDYEALLYKMDKDLIQQKVLDFYAQNL